MPSLQKIDRLLSHGYTVPLCLISNFYPEVHLESFQNKGLLEKMNICFFIFVFVSVKVIGLFRLSECINKLFLLGGVSQISQRICSGLNWISFKLLPYLLLWTSALCEWLLIFTMSRKLLSVLNVALCQWNCE